MRQNILTSAALAPLLVFLFPAMCSAQLFSTPLQRQLADITAGQRHWAKIQQAWADADAFGDEVDAARKEFFTDTAEHTAARDAAAKKLSELLWQRDLVMLYWDLSSHNIMSEDVQVEIGYIKTLKERGLVVSFTQDDTADWSAAISRALAPRRYDSLSESDGDMALLRHAIAVASGDYAEYFKKSMAWEYSYWCSKHRTINGITDAKQYDKLCAEKRDSWMTAEQRRARDAEETHLARVAACHSDNRRRLGLNVDDDLYQPAAYQCEGSGQPLSDAQLQAMKSQQEVRDAERNKQNAARGAREAASLRCSAEFYKSGGAGSETDFVKNCLARAESEPAPAADTKPKTFQQKQCEMLEVHIMRMRARQLAPSEQADLANAESTYSRICPAKH